MSELASKVACAISDLSLFSGEDEAIANDAISLLKEMLKDAERYRWLRKKNEDHSLNSWKVSESIAGGPESWLLHDEELDDAIDKEMNRVIETIHSTKEK